MTFDQAQSPRLGQRVAPERPGVPFVLSSQMPEAPYQGLLVYVFDTAQFQIYDGTTWASPSGSGGGGGGGTPTFVSTTTPTASAIGQLWYHPTTSVLRVWNGAWVEVHDSGIATLTTNVNLATTTANTANAAAAAATTTANSALTAVTGTNVIGATQIHPSAITSKHTLSSPIIVAATYSGVQTMAALATSVITLSSGTFITAPELRAPNMYVTSVPVVTGGSAVFMGASGRLFIHTSARKYKKNIKDFGVEPHDILQLRPVTYDVRKNVLDEDSETDGTGEIGFIADEADDLGLEPLVGRNKDGAVETFHYHKLPIYHQHLLRAMQEEIDSLRADVEMLKAALTEQGD